MTMEYNNSKEGWTVADVRAARQAIKEAFPRATIAEGDYGYALGVKHPNADVAIIIYQPERREIGQPRISTPLAVAMAWLRQPMPPFYGLNTHPRRNPEDSL